MQSQPLRDALSIHAMLELAGEEPGDVNLLLLDSLRSKNNRNSNSNNNNNNQVSKSDHEKEIDERRDILHILSRAFKRVLHGRDFSSQRVCARCVLWVNKPLSLAPFKSSKPIITGNSIQSVKSKAPPCSQSNSFGGNFFHSWSASTRRALGLLPHTPSDGHSPSSRPPSATMTLPVLTDTHVHVLIALPASASITSSRAAEQDDDHGGGERRELAEEYRRAVETRLREMSSSGTGVGVGRKFKYVVSVADVASAFLSTANASVVVTSPTQKIKMKKMKMGGATVDRDSSDYNTAALVAFRTSLMPLGSRYCCGIVDTDSYPTSSAFTSSASASAPSPLSLETQARYMGFEYMNTRTLNADAVASAVGQVVKALVQQSSSSCNTV